MGLEGDDANLDGAGDPLVGEGQRDGHEPEVEDKHHDAHSWNIQ